MTCDIVIRGGQVVDGTGRFIQRSTGYKTTLVNGAVNVLDGAHTGARAGAVLRHAQ